MKLKLSTVVILLLVLFLSALLMRIAFITSQNSNSAFSVSSRNISDKQIKSFRQEPDAPKDISDSSYYTVPIPQNEVPIETVFEIGEVIPVQYLYNNPDWIRPAYKTYWHSSYGRWSYVPNRIHYALHRIFSTYATASIYYDFIHDLGIAKESENFVRYESSSPYNFLQVVVMDTMIEKVLTYENQIVIIGKPQRSGLQAINIPTNMIKPKENTNNIIIQLVTPNGYEIDYTTDTLVTPDQIKKDS